MVQRISFSFHRAPLQLYYRSKVGPLVLFLCKVIMAAMIQKSSSFVFPLLLFLHAMLPFVGGSYGDPLPTLFRDVCIIGGGSGGTYSAIRLQQLGMNVALIEKEDHLGGHVNTFVDAATNTTFDYGVISFDNISVVTNYFAHFEVPLTGLNHTSGNTIYVNFENGAKASPTNASDASLAAALEAYQSQLVQYPYLTTGWQDLPASLPEDFFLPWSDFIQKYQLSGLAYTVSLFLQGIGNILASPTLYNLKYLNLPAVQNILTSGFLSTAHHDNQELYNKALTELGSNALISSDVTKIKRGHSSVEITVSTPSGTQQIQASKLLIAIQPKLSSLSSFLDLDGRESGLLRQFNNSYYWNAVIQNSGIPDNASLNNVNPSNPYGIPTEPGLYSIGATGQKNLHTAFYGSPYYVSDEEVKADILATTGRLNSALGYPTPNGSTELVGFNNHAPFVLTVSNDAIKDGFYRNLTALQGHRNTWWTGAAWQGAQDSSSIWNYTEYEVLPKILG